VAAGGGVVASRIWLAEVLALARVPWTAWSVAAARWSVCVVLVGAMIVEVPEDPVDPVEPEDPDDVAGGVLLITVGVAVVTPLLPAAALDEVPNECVATAAGKACAITGAANSTATRRASEAADGGLRIDISLDGMGLLKNFSTRGRFLGC
jgi:hypothetical protein